MSNHLSATVTLTNEKMQFAASTRTNPIVQMDYFPPLGDGEGYTGLEMLLMSLAGCSASSIVPLLRRMRKTVAGFIVNASGDRREQHPTSFHTIVMEYVVTSPDIEEEDMQKAIHMSEETYCPVWAMLKGNVNITTTFRIERPS